MTRESGDLPECSPISDCGVHIRIRSSVVVSSLSARGLPLKVYFSASLIFHGSIF